MPLLKDIYVSNFLKVNCLRIKSELLFYGKYGHHKRSEGYKYSPRLIRLSTRWTNPNPDF